MAFKTSSKHGQMMNGNTFRLKDSFAVGLKTLWVRQMLLQYVKLMEIQYCLKMRVVHVFLRANFQQTKVE